MPASARLIIALFLLPAALSQVGCVALNIPSHRFQDPADHGGLLGHWRKDGGCSPGSCGPHGEFHSHGGALCCLDGGPLDPTLDQTIETKPPEIPWPRFHPVPTRPVFGVTHP